MNQPAPIGKFLNGTLPQITPGVGGNTTYSIEPAFPNLRFQDPLVITPHPTTNRLFVASRQGLIEHFEKVDNVASKQVFLDLRQETAVVWDGGFLGLTFHPEFGQQGSANKNYFYTFYCAKGDDGNWGPAGCGEKCFTCENDAQWSGSYLRLSRWEVNEGSLTVNEGSELRMVNIRLYGGTHRGGGLTFGNDGFLYCTIGDQARHVTAQNIVSNFEGGVIRIDVDQKGGATSHAPRRKMGVHSGFPDETTGVGYFVPNANPWQDVNNGVFEEFIQIGNRNPHRMTLDKVTGNMWIGEIGQSSREEVSIVSVGGNAGWPVYEGNLFRQVYNCSAHTMPLSEIGPYNPPVADFLRTEANSIIGGYVYRGTQFPGLYGKYICGDYAQNKLFLIEEQGDGSYAKQDFISFTPGALITFGEDQGGEIYMGRQSQNTTLYRLKGDSANPPAPQYLSQLDAFSDLATLEPTPGVIPYDMVEDFWSDGAEKFRWMAIPNDGTHNTPEEKVQFSADGPWKFPKGSVLIKHFELGGKRLETRFEVHGEDGNYYFLSYKWNAQGTDAELLEGGLDETVNINGVNQVWHYPSRLECNSCHSAPTGSTIGPRTRYLNRSITYPSTNISANQLVTLSSLGILDEVITEANHDEFLTMAAKDDPNASLEFRARSYLDLNCGYCHRPGTGNRAAFDMRLSTPLEEQNLLYGSLITDLGIDGARVVVPGDVSRSMIHHRANSLNTNGGVAMPPLAKGMVDEAGVALIAEWIGSMDSDPGALENNLVLKGSASGLSGGCVELTPNAPNQFGAAWYQEPIDLNQDLTISFSLSLGDQNELGDNDNGGDGVAFLFHQEGTNLLNTQGGGSGLGVAGISPSLGVEFDTYSSGGPSELADDHIAIFRNGNLGDIVAGPVCMKGDCGNVEDGGSYPVKIEWNSSMQVLSVYFDGILRTQLSGIQLSQLFDAAKPVYMGLTAAAGGSFNPQVVCNFQVSMAQNSCQSDPGIVVQVENAATCDAKGKVSLSANGGGGTWELRNGQGQLIQDWNALDAGAYTYTYTHMGCSYEGIFEVTEPELPTVSLTSIGTVDYFGGAFALRVGSPAGGTYAGPGVEGNFLNPVIAGEGTHTLTYTYTNEQGCTAVATQLVEVVKNAQAQSISFNSIAEKNTFSEPFDLAATASSGLPVSFEVVEGPASINGNRCTLNGVSGLVKIRASQVGNDAYMAAVPVVQSFEVKKVNQSLTLDPVTEKKVTDLPFPLVASSSYDLPVSLEVVEGPARIEGDTCILNGKAGFVKIRAIQEGNETIEAAEPVVITFEVVKLDQKLSLGELGPIYALDGPLLAGVKANSELPVSMEILAGPAFIQNDTLFLKGVSGRVEVRSGQVGNDQYNPAEDLLWSFEVLKVSQSISMDSVPNLTVDSGPVLLEATASSGLPVAFEIVSGPAIIEAPNMLLVEGTPGEVRLKVYQDGDTTYEAAAEIIQSLIVTEPEEGQDSLSVSQTDLIEAESVGIRLYPVPADHQLNVSWDNPELRITAYYIYNLQGQVVRYARNDLGKTQRHMEIGLLDLAPGPYFLRLFDQNDQAYYSLWIKK